jgi:hypothetical protein
MVTQASCFESLVPGLHLHAAPPESLRGKRDDFGGMCLECAAIVAHVTEPGRCETRNLRIQFVPITCRDLISQRDDAMTLRILFELNSLRRCVSAVGWRLRLRPLRRDRYFLLFTFYFPSLTTPPFGVQTFQTYRAAAIGPQLPRRRCHPSRWPLSGTCPESHRPQAARPPPRPVHWPREESGP